MRHTLTTVLVLAVTATAQDPLPGARPGPLLSAPPNAAIAVQQAFAEIARATWPSVVTVRSHVRKSAEPAGDAPAPAPGAAAGWMVTEASEYPGFELVAAGSGFVVDPSGDVLTCTHVLQRPDGTLADLVDVEIADGSRVVCEVVGVEPTVNLAVLHTMVFPNGHETTLPALRFADSDAMEPGHWTLGFGDPAGPERFLGIGTFVAKPRRDCYQDLLSAFFVQITMFAHPQAYGGPVVNATGEVVGVLAPRTPVPGGDPLAPHTGIEFVLPSKIVAGLYDSIRQARSFRSPWLGFAVMSRAEVATTRGIEAFQAMTKPRTGILIENVWRGGPGETAGIRPGDWLVGFGATRIFTPVEFQRCLYLAGIGAEVELELFGDGATRKVRLVVQQRPADAVPR